MTLSAAGRDYIAQKFGVGNCLVSGGITVEVYDLASAHWTETLGSAQIVARLVTTTMYSKVNIGGVDYTYAALKAANGGADVTSTDITWIADHDDTPASGQTQYCYSYVPPVTGTGYFRVCTNDISALVPGGATIKIDGVAQTAKAGFCPATYTTYTVTSNVAHNVTATASGYNDQSVDKYGTSSFIVMDGDSKDVEFIMKAVAGANTGTVTITAKDKITGTELHALPSVDGITYEEDYVTPVTLNLAISSTATSKVYSIGVKHPGYKNVERDVSVSRSHTPSAPLLVAFDMEEVELYKQVQIYEEMPKVAWLTDWSIASQMALGITTSGWVKFTFTKKTCYRAYLRFYKAPSDWDGSLAQLKATSVYATIPIGPSAVLDPWELSSCRLNWNWTVPVTMTPGTYWVVCTLEYNDDPATCSPEGQACA